MCRCGRGEVTCVVGDNGAGKSVFIKMLCGLIRPSEERDSAWMERLLSSHPRVGARSLGIVAVYQDLALTPTMSLWRNFFMGAEPVKGWGIFQRFDVEYAKQAMQTELEKLGVELGDPDRAAHTLSGGERQGLAIARALYYGATDTDSRRADLCPGCSAVGRGVAADPASGAAWGPRSSW